MEEGGKAPNGDHYDAVLEVQSAQITVKQGKLMTVTTIVGKEGVRNVPVS